MTGCAVDLVDATGRLGGPSSARVRDLLARAAAELGATGEARLRVVGDDEMARAHERYAGVPGTTDVLTFDLRDAGLGDAGSPHAGRGPLDVDVLVCLDEAERRAAELGHEAWREVLLYGVHALLHCLGHDDHDEADAARMHAEEDRVLRAIGVGPVYDAGADR